VDDTTSSGRRRWVGLVFISIAVALVISTDTPWWAIAGALAAYAAAGFLGLGLLATISLGAPVSRPAVTEP
jgi:hypothetical protein